MQRDLTKHRKEEEKIISSSRKLLVDHLQELERQPKMYCRFVHWRVRPPSSSGGIILPNGKRYSPVGEKCGWETHKCTKGKNPG